MLFLCLPGTVYINPTTVNLFFQLPLTLSPVTGRRLDYTTFRVDIGVTNVTKNSRLFTVTSTTCSMVLFSTPIWRYLMRTPSLFDLGEQVPLEYFYCKNDSIVLYGFDAVL